MLKMCCKCLFSDRKKSQTCVTVALTSLNTDLSSESNESKHTPFDSLKQADLESKESYGVELFSESVVKIKAEINEIFCEKLLFKNFFVIDR